MKSSLLLALLSVVLGRSVTRNNDGSSDDDGCDSGSSVLNSSYVHVTFGQSRDNINKYTHQSVQSLVLATNHSNGQFLDGIINLPGHLFYWQSQNGWTGVSQFDYQQGSRDFFIDVLSSQNALARRPGDAFDTWGVPLVNIYNDDAGWAALSNLQAYEAYGRGIFLERAIGVWDFLTTHGYVDQKVLDTGYLQGTKYPNITIMSECNGTSNFGAVYWVNGGSPQRDPSFFDAANSPNVNSVSTGLYALLGAELCRITGDTSYCDQAYTSAHWLDNHMVAEDHLLWDNLNGTDCNLASSKFTYNVGLYIASYAILGSLTNNDTAIQLSEQSAVAAMNTYVWNTPQGINKESDGESANSDDSIGFRAILIRYLHKAHPYLQDQSVKDAIVRYINIQYWALTQLSSDDINQPIRYGRNWTGPAFNISTEHAQLAALDVLNGIQLNPDWAFPSGEECNVPVASASNGTEC